MPDLLRWAGYNSPMGHQLVPVFRAIDDAHLTQHLRDGLSSDDEDVIVGAISVLWDCTNLISAVEPELAALPIRAEAHTWKGYVMDRLSLLWKSHPDAGV